MPNGVPPSIAPNQNSGAPVHAAYIDPNSPLGQFHGGVQRTQQQMGRPTAGEHVTLCYLQDAVRMNDHFFLLFHQQRCQCILGQRNVRDLRAARGLAMVVALLNKQSAIRAEFANIWASFAPTSQTQAVLAAAGAVLASFNKFAGHYSELRQACAARGFPPLAAELRQHLGLESACLRFAVWDAMAHDVWPYMPGHQRTQLRENMARDQRSLDRLRPDERAQLDIELRESYKRIIAGHPMPQAGLQLTAPPNAYPAQQVAPGAGQMMGPQRAAPAAMSAAPAPVGSHVPILRSQPPFGQAPAFAPANDGQNTQRVASRPPQQQQPAEHRLFPLPGQPSMQITPAQPDIFAFHLSGVRSPKTKCVQPDGRTQVNERMYQYVDSYLVEPTLIGIDGRKAIQKDNFNVASLRNAARYENTGLGERGRILSPDSCTYRLRNVAALPANIANISTWLSLETTWHAQMLFHLNNLDLTSRKKLHFGRNLPIDITEHLKEGENLLTIYGLPGPFFDYPGGHSYAIERVRLISRSHFIQLVTSNVTPEHEIVAAIDASISGGLADDSDDLYCLSETIPVKLADPLLGTAMPKTPVRTLGCKHREAFDLETFLDSRFSVGAPVDEPAKPETLVCPICKADAGPERLRVDGWMVEVGRKLAELGARETARVIDVGKGGKFEVREG